MTTDLRSLVSEATIEITARDASELEAVAGSLRPGARVSVTDLATEDAQGRLAAIARVCDVGLTPVPHVAARRVAAVDELGAQLDAMRERSEVRDLVVIAGDTPVPAGPFPDALALIRSGVLDGRGIDGIGIGGYPEGHPAIDDGALWTALVAKRSAARERGIGTEVLTQFGFDVDAVVRYVERLRAAGIDDIVRVGVAGPTNVKQLLRFAARFGARSSAGIVRKYGFSLTNLLGTAGPERFLEDLAGSLTPAHGDVRPHFYTFGGAPATATWISEASA